VLFDAPYAWDVLGGNAERQRRHFDRDNQVLDINQ
jgi:hypothetical protein